MGARRSIVAGLLLLLASPAFSSEAGSTLTDGPAEREPVRVYTNSDLEPLGNVHGTPTLEQDVAGWEFVTEFLEREYERLDADRAHELERGRVAAETEALTRRHGHGYLLLAPYLDRTLQHVGPRPGVPARQGRGCGDHRPVSGWIVPLHARPTPAQRQRARAIRYSGADAVPER